MTPIAWLALVLISLLTTSVLFLVFWWKDVIAAFDKDPTTHTASEKIQHWRKVHGKFGFTVLAWALATLMLSGTGIIVLSVYLFLHLELELL